MKTTSFQRQWIEISEALGLDIRLSYEIDLGGRRLTVPVLLEGYGADKGMVLVADFGLIEDVADALVGLGYGVSCLGEPSPGPIDWKYVEEMLRDWGAVI
jgi:hypothetical protein